MSGGTSLQENLARGTGKQLSREEHQTLNKLHLFSVLAGKMLTSGETFVQENPARAAGETDSEGEGR
jgi:hypothetical protein